MNKNLKHIGVKGRGYFCHVKLYRNENNNEEFAFKELKKEHYGNDEYRYRLNREISILNELQGCENIISLVDYGNDKESESLWYLMPFAKQNLFEYIQRSNSTLSVEQRFELIDQVISAIKYAHNRGILHRDISPNNVLVFNDGGKITIKVSDFGLGKNSESLSYYTGSSASGYGQILYVAPEQRLQLKDATFQSDIYSLGKLIYFICTGKDPDNFKQFELSTLLSKATDEDPLKRFNNIHELEAHYNALKNIIQDQKIPVEYITLRDIDVNDAELSTLHIHNILIKGNHYNHVYSDYISPVVSLLKNQQWIARYHREVGVGVRDFLQVFSERLDECYQSTGWPFTAMNTFGDALSNLVLTVNDERARLLCFKHLWRIAYDFDQWSVQKIMKAIFNETYISKSIEPELAEFIINSEVNVELSMFDSFNLPKTIKIAIIKGKQNREAKIRESIKSGTSFEADF